MSVVEAAPTAAPAVAPTAEAGVSKVVQDWTAAWSSKRFDTYVGFYAPGFQTGKMTKEQWLAQRRARVTRPGDVSVTVDNLKVMPTGEGRAITTFRQTYRWAGFSDVSDKSLEWVKSNGKWLIERESNR